MILVPHLTQILILTEGKNIIYNYFSIMSSLKSTNNSQQGNRSSSSNNTSTKDLSYYNTLYNSSSNLINENIKKDNDLSFKQFNGQGLKRQSLLSPVTYVDNNDYSLNKSIE